MRLFIPLFISLIVLTSIACFSCANSEINTISSDSRTQYFSTYLKYNFDDSIKNEHHLFILITKKDSRENISTILQNIKTQLFSKQPSTFTVIASVNMPVADSLVPLKNTKTDWDGAIEKLNLPLSGVTLIQTANKKIIDLRALSIESAGSQEEFLQW